MYCFLNCVKCWIKEKHFNLKDFFYIQILIMVINLICYNQLFEKLWLRSSHL